ncbi:hypothetical protein [Mycobacterium sp. MUNTM1]
MNKTIRSRDYKNVYANFDVLVDPKPSRGEPVVAILVEPKNDEKFIIPMDLKAARDLGVMLIDTLVKLSPDLIVELFNG